MPSYLVNLASRYQMVSVFVDSLFIDHWVTILELLVMDHEFFGY